MSDLLSIGAASVRAYQTALSTTSENIANAATPGYQRRSVVMEEFGRTTSVSLGQAAQLTGAGSRIAGIARAADEFRSAEARTSGSDLAKTEASIVWIDRIESALTGNQLSARFASFFASAKGVAADPAATAPRTVFLEDARSLAAGFQSTGRALAVAADQLIGQGEDIAAQLTDMGKSLAKINLGLTRASPGSITHAQLLDDRDRTLEGMSALVDVNVSLDQYGRATVRAGIAPGAVITDVENAHRITLARGSEGKVTLLVHDGGDPTEIRPGGGAMAGLADGSERIYEARTRLDTIATDFVADINAWQAAGKRGDGTAGPALFAVNKNAEGVAGPPTDFAVLDTFTARDVAAARDVGGTVEGARGNSNIEALMALRTGKGWEAKFDDLTVDNAALLNTRKSVAQAQGSIHGAAVAARDGVIGVDMDEEAVNLIRFQQAYQASSRVIQVARDILQTIIDIR